MIVGNYPITKGLKGNLRHFTAIKRRRIRTMNITNNVNAFSTDRGLNNLHLDTINSPNSINGILTQRIGRGQTIVSTSSTINNTVRIKHGITQRRRTILTINSGDGRLVGRFLTYRKVRTHNNFIRGRRLNVITRHANGLRFRTRTTKRILSLYLKVRIGSISRTNRNIITPDKMYQTCRYLSFNCLRYKERKTYIRRRTSADTRTTLHFVKHINTAILPGRIRLTNVRLCGPRHNSGHHNFTNAINAGGTSGLTKFRNGHSITRQGTITCDT